MNIAMPSLMIKMMRQKFDQQWSVRKSESTAAEQSRVLELIKPSRVEIDVRLPVQNIQARDLLALQAGDVLAFDLPVRHSLDVVLNGRRQFSGHVVNTGKKRAAMVDAPVVR
jgi:flagellar motor switch protein FliM